MDICKSHKKCFMKICSLCEDYEPLSSDAVLAEVRALRARNEKLTDIINWMSNGYGIDVMENEYDIEMAELKSEHFR